MAFIGESREDFRHSWSNYVCLDKEDSQIVLQALGPVVGRYYKTYEYYKGIHEAGEATEKQTDKLMKAEENYNTIIYLRNQLVEYLRSKDK